MKKLPYLLLLLLAFTVTACSSDDDPDEQKRTEYPVYYKAHSLINSAAFDMINTVGLIIFDDSRVKYGNKGLFIFNKNDRIRAFDIACPYEWDERVYLIEELPGANVTCKSCESVFNTYTGEAISGKAKEARTNMVEYHVEEVEKELGSSIREIIVTN